MMKYECSRKALEEVAKREGISLEVVVSNIEFAINEAIAACRNEGNKAALKIWE